MLYLGAKPYKAVLSADCKSLGLEPWSGPLAELALQPQGGQVGGIQLAWESAPGQWQLLQPGVENGKASVPPGNYRLYTTTIKAKTSPGGTLVVSGYKRSLNDTSRPKRAPPRRSSAARRSKSRSPSVAKPMSSPRPPRHRDRF